MSLRESTFSATRWTTTAALIRVGVQVLQTAILARLLAPSDFGLIAIAGVALSITSLVADLGLSSALMHFPQPDRPTLSTLYWLNLGLACLLALLFIVLAHPLAQLYGQVELRTIFCLLSLTFPLSALGSPFRALAEKNLQFRLLAQNEIIAAALGLIAALTLAANGAGVFTLAIAPLVSTCISSILAWSRLSAGLRPIAAFQPALARPFISFGLHRVGDGFWNALRVQLDVFIAGVIAPPAAVAHYAMPREQCLKVSTTVINPVITRVGLPIMTRLQDDPSGLRFMYLKILRMTASLNFPIYAALALFAEDVVLIFMGDQWHEAAFYMRLFAMWGLIRSIGNPSGSLLYAVGMAKRAHAWNMALFFSSAPVLWLAAKMGNLSALASTLLAWQLVVFVASWRFLIKPACGAGFRAYAGSIAPPLLVTILCAASTYVFSEALADPWRLPLGLVLFGILYLALSLRFSREWIDAVLELVSPLHRRPLP